MTPRLTLDDRGWIVLPGVVGGSVLENLRTTTKGLLDKAGKRGILDTEWARKLVLSNEVQTALSQLGFAGAACVRGLLFDKQQGANWAVPWHQDRNIAVAERGDEEGFRAWSVKDGVVHCQPPQSVLEEMVTLRLHLDDCGPENGPVRIIESSHSGGFLTVDESARLADTGREAMATCKAGDCIAMRPLVLHASSQATAVAHRRVVHLEFAATSLPGRLQWRWAVRP